MKYSNLFALGLLAFLLAVPQGAGAASFLSPLEDQTFQVGTPVSITLPHVDENSGTCARTHRTAYSISPALPPGLSFNGNNDSRVLSGTPTQVNPTTQYTYTGHDSACYTIPTVTETFNITVSAAASGGVTVNPTSLEVDEDGWGYYQIVLDSAPSANVTIKLSRSGDKDIFAFPMNGDQISFLPLTFTTSDWSQAKRVGVVAAPDPDETDGSATITHTASSSDSNYDNITITDVSVTEDDHNRSVDGDCGWGYACADETPAPVSASPAESVCSRQSTQELQYDCETLSGLYDETGGSEWEQSGNWLTESSLEEWYGVSVSGGRVSELDLSGNGLSGEIPDLSALGGLETLDLSGNEELGGGLPLGLMNLPGLDTVDVRCTDVTAPDDAGFDQWLDGIDFGDAEDCASTAVPETEPQDDVSTPEKDEGASRGGCAVSGKAGTGAGAAFELFLAAFLLLAVSRGRSRSGPRRFIESG